MIRVPFGHPEESLTLPFFRDQLLDRSVGIEGVGLHAGGAAFGAEDLVGVGVGDLEPDLVLGEHAFAHAASQSGLAHAALLSLDFGYRGETFLQTIRVSLER
jgi:hypothetical protein